MVTDINNCSSIQSLYRYIKTLGKNNLKKLISSCYVHSFLNNFRFSIKTQLLCILCSVSFHTTKNEDNKDNPFTITASYIHNILDNVSINRIINSNKIKNIVNSKHFTKCLIVYKYENPISQKVFNYSQFLRNIDRDKGLNIINSECCCKQNKYIKHVDAKIGYSYG